MVDMITYRTTDMTRWGGGLGTDLSAAQIDINFWVLESQLIAIQDHLTNVADIDFFNVVGNQLFVHLTNHVVLGPYTLPTSQWNFRHGWEPLTHYAPFDIFTFAGSFYMVLFDHTSAATFDPGAGDGGGGDLYGLLLASVNPIPLDGTVGQVLTKTAGSPDEMAWETQHRNLGLYIEGFPQPGETLLRYDVPESMTLPAGMALSRASSDAAATGSTIYSIFKNATEIGTVTFGAGATLGVYDLVSDTAFDPGDLLLLVAPASPDLTQQAISFTLVANLP